MESKRKRHRRPPQKVQRVWTPEEWLAKTDWKRFAPQNPKRQAYELIRAMAKRKAAGKWVEKVSKP
jgi:hypothetical protein